GKLEVGEVADPGLRRAVDVANKPGGARNRRDLQGAIKTAGLCGVDRYDLCRSFVDDLYDVVGIPRAFVRHHRRVYRARDLGATRDPDDGLLKREELEPLRARMGADRPAGRAVAVVGGDAQREAGPTRLAAPPHYVHITIGIDADLDLDRTNSFLCDLC